MKTIGSLRLLSIAVFLFHATVGGWAATFVWTGPTNGSWNTPTNWFGDTVPVSADDTRLEFTSSTNRLTITNDLAGDTTVNRLTTAALGTNSVDLRTLSTTPRRLRFAGTAPTINHTSSSNRAQLVIRMPLSLEVETFISNLGNADLLNLVQNVEGVGPLRVAAGRVIIGTPGILRPTNGTIVEAGGELWVGDAAGTPRVQSAVTVQPGGAVSLTPAAIGAAPLHLAGEGTDFSRTGALHTERTTANGSTANASWTGPITLDAPTTIATRDGSLTLSGGLNLNGHTLTVADPADGAGTVGVQTTGLSGTGGVTVNGGALSLEVASTFAGPLLVQSNGVLNLSLENALGQTGHPLTLDGGTLVFTFPTFSAARPLTLGPGGGTLFPPSSSVINAVISGPGRLRVGTGFLTLNGLNSHGGGTEVNSGTVIVSADQELGAAGGPVILNGGSLSLEGNFNLDPTRAITTVGGTLSFKFDSVLGSAISGSGRLTLTRRFDAVGQPVITLTETNTQNGLRLVDIVGSAASAANLGDPTSTLEITNQGVLRLLASFDLGPQGTNLYDGKIDTSGHDMTISRPGIWKSLTKLGDGVLTLAASNSLSVPPSQTQTIVEGGILRVAAPGAVPFGGSVRLFNSAQLDLNGINHTFQAINPGVGSVRLAGANLTLTGGGSIDEGVIGPGAVEVQQSGLVLRGLCSQTSTTVGTTNLTSVTPSLTIESGSALGVPGAPLTLRRGGRISTFSSPDPIVLDATHAVMLDGGGGFSPSGELVVEGAVSGFGGLNVGGGTLALMNVSNTFAGHIFVVGDATLRLGDNRVLGADTNTIRLGSAVFDGESWRVAGGTLQAGTNLTLPATRLIQLAGRSDDSGLNHLDSQAFTFTIDGNITEFQAGGDLIKVGSGTLRLNGLNTISDELVVQEGTLGGSGTVQNVRLHSGTVLAPGAGLGTFHTANVQWREGAGMAFELGAGGVNDRLEVGGALTGDTDTPRPFVFSGAPALTTYTLITGTSGGNLFTDFEQEDFTFTGPAGLAGTFSLDNTGLKFTVTNLPGGGGDSDNDGLPDDWETTHFDDLAQTADGDPDGDGQSNAFEYAAGTDPDDSASRFTFELSSLTATGTTLYFAPALTNRIYALEASEHLAPASWQIVSNALFTPTNGGQSILDPNTVAPQKFYRLQITGD